MRGAGDRRGRQIHRRVLSIVAREPVSAADADPQLLFFTFADARYSCFVVPYIHFALTSNPASMVEVCVDDLDVFLARSSDAIELLSRAHAGRFLVRQSEVCRRLEGAIPNTIRFLERPQLRAANVYIGDIDILVFDDVLTIHSGLMQQAGLPFSNVLRKEHLDSAKPRLSGLHFCPYDLFYPQADVTDLDLARENDEFVLYELMRRKGVMVDAAFQERPECGIHMSLSRDPRGRTSGVSLSTYRTGGGQWEGQEYFNRFLHHLHDPGFLELYPYLDLEFRLLLSALEALATNRLEMLHRTALSYMIDRRLLVSEETVVLKEVLAEHDGMMERLEHAAAFDLGLKLCALWPSREDAWVRLAQACISSGRNAQALAALHHLCQLPNGIKMLRRNGFFDINRERIDQLGEDGQQIAARVCGA